MTSEALELKPQDGRHARITDIIEKLWQKMSDEAGGLPPESALDIDAISDIWDHCFYLQVEPDRPYLYQYGYMGDALVEAFGVDFTKSVGDDIYDLVKASKDEVQKKFQEVCDTKGIVHDDGEFCNMQHLTIKYRQILVPFTTNNKDVTYILGGVRWTVM